MLTGDQPVFLSLSVIFDIGGQELIALIKPIVVLDSMILFVFVYESCRGWRAGNYLNTNRVITGR